ncbi:hypothetical protein AGMMS50229_06650 [Campylobacterota bacterium]|nr:hypothetical protein AGMMS50229_06650 [Campylobacterota bacterium]
MIKAEIKASIWFLLLYGGSLIVFMAVIGVGNYQFYSAQILKQQQKELRLMAFDAGRMLRSGEMPPDGVEWALLDDFGSPITGEFALPSGAHATIATLSNISGREQMLSLEDKLYLFIKMPRHSNAAFFAVRAPLNTEALDRLKVSVALIWFAAFVFFMAVGAALTRLFLRPLRDTINLLDRFIKDATHELTTPISAILMSVEGISRDALADRDKKRLDRIVTAARTLQIVYDDLSFATLEHQSRRAPSQIDLAALIEQRAEFFEPAGRLRQICWQIDIAEYEPLVADERELTRIIDNLISNAIKYNRQGGVLRVAVSGRSLAIEDEGSGIPEGERKRIFERFTRLDSAQGGFGLGLNIVKELCVRGAIAITVEDREGGGARFVLRW